jgi:hypothetical protein
MLLPREKPPEALVPRVVSTWSDGCVEVFRAGWAVIVMSSNQPLNSAGPAGLSYPTRIRATCFPAATLPSAATLWFHWSV